MSGNLKGILWMLVTSLFFVGVTGLVRHLGSTMSPVQAAFIRYAIGVVFLLPVFMQLAGQRKWPRRMGMHAVRGVFHGVGVMLWFYAMTRLPVAEVTALGFIAPIFTTIGAAMFLGETLRFRRIAAVVIGFGGTLVILRPGLEIIDLGAVAQLLAAPLFAGSILISKKLTATDSSPVIVAWLSIFVTLTLLPGAIYVWRTPTWEEMFFLMLTALLATLGHLTMTQAFRHAEIAAIQPISFIQLVCAALLGLYAFGEEPDLWTVVGGAIIVGSATYIAHREARLRKGG